MKKALALLTVAMVALISACQTPPAPSPTAAPVTQPPPTAAAPEATTSVPPTPSAAPEGPTATPAAPAGACTDGASFVADVTIPDYSHFDPREAFTKTWRVKNVGTCTWTTEYKAVY